MPEQITLFVSKVASVVSSFAIAMAAVGVLSMAILQTIKDTLPVRRWFQRAWFRSWLEQRVHGRAAEAEEDILRSATSDDKKAFYDLPIEQLCGQLNAAAQVALDFPQRHKPLLEALAAKSDRSDFTIIANGPKPEWATATVDQPPDPEKNAYIEARNRVSHHVQRAFDSIQISAGFRWKYYMQITSFLLSAAIASAAILFNGTVSGRPAAFSVILAGILGGFLAPVARDLVAALQQLRK